MRKYHRFYSADKAAEILLLILVLIMLYVLAWLEIHSAAQESPAPEIKSLAYNQSSALRHCL